MRARKFTLIAAGLPPGKPGGGTAMHFAAAYLPPLQPPWARAG